MSKSYRIKSSLKHVELVLQDPDFTIDPDKLKPKYRQGIIYEREGHRYFNERFGNNYLPGPWFRFLDRNGWHWAQADGLLFDLRGGKIIVFEFKIKHHPNAYYQLFDLYYPLVEHLFPKEGWTIGLCEVCKWYDKDTAMPKKPHLYADITMVKPGDFGVHIWRP